MKKEIDKLDDPDNDIYYCRSFDMVPQRIPTYTHKDGKSTSSIHYFKKTCLLRMKIVPSHNYKGEFFANYAYCEKHQLKHILGY